MQKIEIVSKVKNPLILVITPLLPGDIISKKTKKTIKRNKVPYTWISSQGKNNIPINILKGLEWYKEKLPPYIFPLDNDIILGKNLLDKLYKKLYKTPDFVAFSYASFQYKGYRNFNFPADKYDINRMMKHNYISSNSLFKSNIYKDIGLVTDQKFVRLLDWCFYLKLFYEGYIGIPCPEASFIAKSEEDGISSWEKSEYEEKRKIVLETYVKKIIDKYRKEK